MSTSIFGISVSGLSAAQAGLITAQNNIANANTAGYHRQETVQSQALPMLSGIGFLGQGTSVDTVKRIYSQFLDSQVRQTETLSSYLDSYYSQVKQIDNMLGDPAAGLTPALQSFFISIQALAANPGSTSARQGVLSSASSMVGRFDMLSQQLQDLRTGVNTQITSTVGEINSYAQQIADLNQQIATATSATSNGTKEPNGMLDQRDQLIAELNKLVQVTVAKQPDGSLNVYIGNGQALVVGNRTFTLSATQSKDDPDNLVVGYAAGNGNVSPLSDNSLTGGALGGLLSFRNGILDSAMNGLGRVAVGLAQTFNAQHKLGVDLSGNMGGDFFNIASSTPWVQANTNNSAGATLSATYNGNAGALTTDNYRITYDGTNYSLINLSTNATTAGLSAAALQTAMSNLGLTLSITGSPSAGDRWLVLPTRYGASGISLAVNDVLQIAAAAPVVTSAPLTNTGTATIDAGSVDSSFTGLAAAVTLTYDSSTGKFSASPAKAITVTSGGTTTTYASGTPFTYVSGATISFGGISFSISGTPGNNDTFTISPNYGTSFNGVSDNRNATLLGQLQINSVLQNNSSGNPSATLQSAYGQLVSLVGNNTREYEVRSKAQASLVAQAQQEQQSLSGVNLDEEAANLLRYQQAYQAAGKALETASKLFDTLLAAFG